MLSLKIWTSIKIILLLILILVIFLVAKIKPWAVDKWNSYDQKSPNFSPQITLEFLVKFFNEYMIHVYPHMSSLITQRKF
jgi:sterol desaturase/sphingolipid hydroxylase (fatty acid hydroxylase superfamily)